MSRNKDRLYKKQNCDVRFLDNNAIEEYASGDSLMHKNLKPIKDILIREKCKEKTLFSFELALDLDQVEIDMHKGTSFRGMTVDFVVGLENKHLLLAEAKFDAKNMTNVASDIKEKLKHSKQILISNHKFRCFHEKNVILLSNNKFEENKRKLKTLLNNDPSFTPLKASGFYNEYFG